MSEGGDNLTQKQEYRNIANCYYFLIYVIKKLILMIEEHYFHC